MTDGKKELGGKGREGEREREEIMPGTMEMKSEEDDNFYCQHLSGKDQNKKYLVEEVCYLTVSFMMYLP